MRSASLLSIVAAVFSTLAGVIGLIQAFGPQLEAQFGQFAAAISGGFGTIVGFVVGGFFGEIGARALRTSIAEGQGDLAREIQELRHAIYSMKTGDQSRPAGQPLPHPMRPSARPRRPPGRG